MNATELYTKEGEPTGIYFCGKCRCVLREKSLVDTCCICTECGKPRGKNGHTLCDPCNDIRIKETEDKFRRQNIEALEKAEIVESEFFFFGDKFYEDTETLLEDCATYDIPEPEFCFAAKPEYLSSLGLEDLLCDIEENIECEDFNLKDHINDDEFDVLSGAFERFNEYHKDIIMYYTEDRTKKVRIS